MPKLHSTPRKVSKLFMVRNLNFRCFDGRSRKTSFRLSRPSLIKFMLNYFLKFRLSNASVADLWRFDAREALAGKRAAAAALSSLPDLSLTKSAVDRGCHLAAEKRSNAMIRLFLESRLENWKLKFRNANLYGPTAQTSHRSFFNDFIDQKRMLNNSF